MKNSRDVRLTRLEIRGLLAAIGNSLTGCADDEEAIVGSRSHIRAAYRGRQKLIRALYGTAAAS